MTLKRLIPTSYAMALVVLSFTVLPLPVWIGFSSFGYFGPTFALQLFLSLPFLVNAWLMLSAFLADAMVVHVFVITDTVLTLAFLYWVAGRICSAWLLKHYPWFRSVR